MESIFLTIKKMLGLDPEYDAFNLDILVDINSALMSLNQLGVGPTSGFTVTGEDETWEDLLGSASNLEAVKSYIFLKVKTMFDAPSSSYALDSLNKMIAEHEWRIMIQVENQSHS